MSERIPVGITVKPPIFMRGQRVRDTRYGIEASVVSVNDWWGRDGHGIAVICDDDPDSVVSTGSDYFEETL
jgi:uncharacterized protein YlxP (DUF503 family)